MLHLISPFTANWFAAIADMVFVSEDMVIEAEVPAELGARISNSEWANSTDEATVVTILPSGRIIVAGLTWDATIQPFNPSRDFALAEYEWR